MTVPHTRDRSAHAEDGQAGAQQVREEVDGAQLMSQAQKEHLAGGTALVAQHMLC